MRTDNALVTVTSAPAGETFRDQFTGKADQGPDFAVPYTDFGARHYSPALSRWLVPDPLSEKYYDVSPYVYCDGNPIMFIDETGREGVRYLDKYGVKTVETTIIVLLRQEKVIHENSSTKTISKMAKYLETRMLPK